MAFTWFDDDLRVTDFLYLFGKEGAQFLADRSINPSGASVGNYPLCVERAEISARRNISCSKFKPEAKRFDNTAPDLKFKRVITEQRKMTGTASRGNSRCNWNHSALGRLFGKRIEIWSGGGLQRRLIILFACSEVADAIENEEDQFG